MTEHRVAAFAHSCVKVPLDRCSRQPTPAYERPRTALTIGEKLTSLSSLSHLSTCGTKEDIGCNRSGANSRMDNKLLNELLTNHDHHHVLIDCAHSLSDCESHHHRHHHHPNNETHHLTSEQFKQKLDHLKRRQRLLLKNLRNCLEQADRDDNLVVDNNDRAFTAPQLNNNDKTDDNEKTNDDNNDLALKGRKCHLEAQSRPTSPCRRFGNFSCLTEDQDLLTYRRNPELNLCRYKEKAAKTLRNEKIVSSDKCCPWSSGSESNKSPIESIDDSREREDEIGHGEIKSLTSSLSPTRCWQKPFNLALREETEKYLNDPEQQETNEIVSKQQQSLQNKPKNPAKKRRIRQVPLTSKIPLYDKLMAEKEERSRIVREESALSLLSQVRPFKLECERRALRAHSRASPPELLKRSRNSTTTRFKAKPVPRDLFSTDVYDRMLEEEYFRHLQKRVRASELLRSASLPPSMAKRERNNRSSSCSRINARTRNLSSFADERSRSCGSIVANQGATESTTTRLLNSSGKILTAQGNNLAALLRAQASREKLEREIQERLEEKRREQLLRLRKSLIGKKPAWRALRFAARHEHERDLDFRVSLRRDEAREQAERHKLQMELMQDRVTRIPTLFERYSQLDLEDESLLQSFQSAMQLHRNRHKHRNDDNDDAVIRPYCFIDRASMITKIKKKPTSSEKRRNRNQQRSSSSNESYISVNSCNNSRPSSGTISSSSTPPGRVKFNDINCRNDKTTDFNGDKKKQDNRTRPLKVSINETAELIEDETRHDDDEGFYVDSANSRLREEREKRALGDADDSVRADKEE